ncbi:MAG: tape measure protein, partial [Bilophila sp.]
MTGSSTTTVGIEVRAEGTQSAARDLAVVDASVKKIGTSLGTVSQFASTAKLDRTIADLGDMGVKINANSRHVQNLARMMQAVDRDRAFRQLAQDANLSTLQLAKLRAEMGDTRGALATLSSGFGSAKVAALAFAAALALGGKAALEAALQMDRLQKAYTTITGSASAAQVQLTYLYDVSNRLGLQFQSTAEAAKTFFAAGKGTSLEKDMNAIFEAVSSAGSALSLSTDDMHGAFLALGQMISKGKVQAEELRGQLGERLPGAFQLAAKAMNMTTAQLDKFMSDGKLTAEDLLPKLAKVMREDFGAAAEEAAKGIQGALNRLSTEWTLFKASLVDSEAAVAGIDAVRGTVAMLQAAFDTLAKYKDIFKALAVGIGIAALIALVPRATEAVLGLASAFKTLLPLLVANPWTLAAVAVAAV